ncbi:MAG: 4Fe-4S binding protein [Dehalococcoidia bacterium]
MVQDSQLINLDKTKCMNCRYCRTECPRGAIKFR